MNGLEAGYAELDVENKILPKNVPLCAFAMHAKELRLVLVVSPFDIMYAIANGNVLWWWKIGLSVVRMDADIASLHAQIQNFVRSRFRKRVSNTYRVKKIPQC